MLEGGFRNQQQRLSSCAHRETGLDPSTDLDSHQSLILLELKGSFMDSGGVRRGLFWTTTHITESFSLLTPNKFRKFSFKLDPLRIDLNYYCSVGLLKKRL